MTVAGAGQMAVLGAYMLAKTGEITYYFYKIGLGHAAGLRRRLRCTP